MIIQDRVYGKISIKNTVIEELILSHPLQRLKKISQDGATHFFQPVRNVNRFEHSVGVWYLSYFFKRSIEEQIACLLHDVPHTAFSHVIDFVMDDEKHEFHEKFAEKMILNSEIPNILKSHKINIKNVLQKNNFPLLENNLPDISFDRWDYFMRDGTSVGYMPRVLVHEFLENIYSEKDRLYFKDINLASVFAILFMSYSRLLWLDPTSHGGFFLISEALKLALKKGLISQDDFFTDDEYLMNKLRIANNKQINKWLGKLTPQTRFIYANKKEAEFFGPNKPRFVDPLVLYKRKFKRLSVLVPSLDYAFEEFVKNYKYLGVRQL